MQLKYFALSQCDSQCHVPWFAAGDDTSTMFGVFDAHPMTLKGLRAAGPPVLPAAQLLTMGLHVLDGLLFLQANRIAHCDIKLDNVLVDACGCCYIADLGEAFELVSGYCVRLCDAAGRSAVVLYVAVRDSMQPDGGNSVNLRYAFCGNQLHRAPEVATALRALLVPVQRRRLES